MARTRVEEHLDVSPPSSQTRRGDYNKNYELDRADAVIQEFQVSVTPVGVDEYLVRTERVEPGVPLAEEQAIWPVDRWTQQARQLMDNPIAGLLQGNPSSSTQAQSNLVALGQELYNALFHGDLRDSWMMAQAIAQNHQQPLRLRLGLKGNRLPVLPWEVLHDGDYPLATGTNLLFSRYQPGTHGLAPPPISTPLSPDRPLRVLMAISAPSDRANLQLTREAEDLEAELQRLTDEGQGHVPTEVTILKQPDRARLTQALEHGHYQVFHYAGHSSSGLGGGTVSLVNQTTGLTEDLNGDDLAGLLANNGIHMVVFNSCRGAHTDFQKTGERSLAAALVKRGIPAVLAMAERIPDEVALTLTRLFYRNLSRGCPIDLSVSRARQGLISAYSSHQLYWSLPIFYLHPQCDGYLAQVSGEEEFVKPPSQSSPSFPLADRPSPLLAAEEVAVRNAEDSLSPRKPERRLPEDALDDLELDNLSDDDRFPADDNPPPTEAEPSRAEDEAFVTEMLQTLMQSPPPPGEIAPSDAGEVTPKPPKSAPLTATPPLLEFAKRRKWLLSAVGVGVLLLGALLVWGTRDRTEEPVVVVPRSQPNPNPSDRLENYPTQELTGLAISDFSTGNWQAGALATAELLSQDRNALTEAEAALAVIPTEEIDRPPLLFLKGRLAWQKVQIGDRAYSIDDARRYWKFAADADPNSPLYRVALGFAYYAENNFAAARDAFETAIAQLEDGEVRISELGGFTQTQMRHHAYAGLALSLARLAQNTPNTDRQIAQAAQLRRVVLDEAPTGFNANALQYDWLWRPEAINDWQDLPDLLDTGNEA